MLETTTLHLNYHPIQGLRLLVNIFVGMIIVAGGTAEAATVMSDNIVPGLCMVYMYLEGNGMVAFENHYKLRCQYCGK